ncbi:MAG: hypothetical protein GY807_05375 [Gammaproteobacteria bacterium]|nr:hypothetical protein [Gammaproteobacteria bacterium]
MPHVTSIIEAIRRMRAREADRLTWEIGDPRFLQPGVDVVQREIFNDNSSRPVEKTFAIKWLHTLVRDDVNRRTKAGDVIETLRLFRPKKPVFNPNHVHVRANYDMGIR